VILLTPVILQLKDISPPAGIIAQSGVEREGIRHIQGESFWLITASMASHYLQSSIPHAFTRLERGGRRGI
jgi:hypothetical protein